jgi:hypothetical protein
MNMAIVPIDRLQSRCGNDLESIVQFSFPFSKAGRVLLVVLSATAKRLSWVYEELWQADLHGDWVICLRASELQTLGLPGPVVTTASMPYWLQETGQTLHGADVRQRVVVARGRSRLLSYHLDRVQSSRHRILELLIRQEYEALDAYLLHERRSLMYAALFSQGEWRVFPNTLEQQFMAMWPTNTELHEHAAAAGVASEDLRRAPNHADADARRGLAYRSVWLFEQFSLGLSRHAA